MSFSKKLKTNVLLRVLPEKMRKEYSIGFYTGGIDMSEWRNLPKETQNAALSKDWYIRWSYRNPETGKLEKQTHIKAGVNEIDTIPARLHFLKTYRKGMIESFEMGIHPFAKEPQEEKDTLGPIPTKEAIKKALSVKKLHMKHDSFIRYKSDINKFIKYLDQKQLMGTDISKITKKTINNYLNDSLAQVSARSRNHYRTSLGSLWETMKNEEIVPENFIKSIPMLKSIPQRNKTYSNEQVEALFTYMAKEYPNLLLFVKILSYNFLRPLEVCRLKVGDFDLNNRTLTVMVKQGRYKTKTIPTILLKELPDLKNKEGHFFTKTGLFGNWNIKEESKRNHFSSEFKKVKEHFELGEDYGLYSFRHYFTTKLYRELRTRYTPFEAKSNLMTITGHATMKALEKYLRSIDVELAEDYSHLLK